MVGTVGLEPTTSRSEFDNRFQVDPATLSNPTFCHSWSRPERHINKAVGLRLVASRRRRVQAEFPRDYVGGAASRVLETDRFRRIEFP